MSQGPPKPQEPELNTPKTVPDDERCECRDATKHPLGRCEDSKSRGSEYCLYCDRGHTLPRNGPQHALTGGGL